MAVTSKAASSLSLGQRLWNALSAWTIKASGYQKLGRRNQNIKIIPRNVSQQKYYNSMMNFCVYVFQVSYARTFTMKMTWMCVRRYVDCQRKSNS